MTVVIIEEITPDGVWWVAQCLEYDIAAQACSVPGVLQELGRIVAAELAIAERFGVEPFGAS